jgi:hypothetical protein
MDPHARERALQWMRERNVTPRVEQQAGRTRVILEHAGVVVGEEIEDTSPDTVESVAATLVADLVEGLEAAGVKDPA